MFDTFRNRDYVRGCGMVNPYHEYHSAVEPAETFQSLFAVALALVLNRQHRCIEDHFAVRAAYALGAAA